MSESDALFRDHFWDVITTGLPAVHIPIYIKNILELSGFDNIAVLRKIDPERIHKLEEFVRNKMRVLIEAPLDTDEEKRNYYHLYYKIPTQFEIVEGHKELIMEISQFVDSSLKTHGFNFFTLKQENPVENAIRLENIMKAKQQEILLNIDDLCDSLYHKLRNWIEVKRFEQIFPLMEPAMISVNVIENDLDDEECEERFSYSATIVCPICHCAMKAKYKSYKSKGHTRSRRWYDNFDRHIIDKHSSENPEQTDGFLRVPRKRKMEFVTTPTPQIIQIEHNSQHSNDFSVPIIKMEEKQENLEENMIKAKQQENQLIIDDLCGNLYKKLRDWIAVKRFDQIFPLMEPSMIVVNASENDLNDEERFSYSATIVCPVCHCVMQAKYKAYKTKGNNRSKRWYDNFDRHIIEKHAPENPDGLTRVPRNRKKESPQVIKMDESQHTVQAIKKEEMFF